MIINLYLHIYIYILNHHTHTHNNETKPIANIVIIYTLKDIYTYTYTMI